MVFGEFLNLTQDGSAYYWLKSCERFKFKELAPCMFKWFILVAIRNGIVSKLEQHSKISQQMVAEECKRIKNILYVNTRNKERVMSKINTVNQKHLKVNIYP